MAEATDVVLVGGGIMSATLGVLLKELEPSWEITLIERLEDVALESSNAWNNAGTGHSALCELNYAPLTADGTIDPTRALNIAEQFHISRQFWATLVEEGKLTDRTFINSVPHMSLVMNADHCSYLQKRFDVFKNQKLFEKMEFSTDRAQIAEWAPLVVNGRDENQSIAANYSAEATDVVRQPDPPDGQILERQRSKNQIQPSCRRPQPRIGRRMGAENQQHQRR